MTEENQANKFSDFNQDEDVQVFQGFHGLESMLGAGVDEESFEKLGGFNNEVFQENYSPKISKNNYIDAQEKALVPEIIQKDNTVDKVSKLEKRNKSLEL